MGTQASGQVDDWRPRPLLRPSNQFKHFSTLSVCPPVRSLTDLPTGNRIGRRLFNQVTLLSDGRANESQQRWKEKSPSRLTSAARQMEFVKFVCMKPDIKLDKQSKCSIFLFAIQISSTPRERELTDSSSRDDGRKKNSKSQSLHN